MQQHKQLNRMILGLLALGVLAGTILTAGSAQAASGAGPYFPEPAWSRKLPAATRFLVLTDWNNEAVLDKETGLVWERTPDSLPQYLASAKFTCLNRTVGNRRGWRLPSIVELTTLVHPSAITGPTLPPGHPFVGIQSTFYWSATTDAENPTTNAFFLNFNTGGVGGGPITDVLQVWCVRGGLRADAY